MMAVRSCSLSQGSGETGKSKWKKWPFTTAINSKQQLVSILITVVENGCFAGTLLVICEWHDGSSC